MTCCIPQLSFSFYRHQPIRADFSGGQITSDAGLLPLRAFDQHHHVTHDLAQLLSAWFCATCGVTYRFRHSCTKSRVSRASRLLVVCPAGIMDQWQQEVRVKFGFTFTIFDSDNLHTEAARNWSNPWAVEPRVIASMDFIKRREGRSGISLRRSGMLSSWMKPISKKLSSLPRERTLSFTKTVAARG